MKSIFKISRFLVFFLLFVGCNSKKTAMIEEALPNKPTHKAVVYQVFTRLFGNPITTNKPWGTIEENGVGKFADFSDTALEQIKNLGVTHIWYTGVPHHAVIRDYTAFGIDNDDPDVVKGRAGSPYAVKDYYNVDPDLATNPAKRLEEFEALIQRTHKHQLKVIIDIVPNHVARHYKSTSQAVGETDFGANDDKSVEYSRNNNFYYIPNSSFEVPTDEHPDSHRDEPLGGEKHPLADRKFEEIPAKWTGNGSRATKPSINDWYETVKINYGVRPDGTKDFPLLPEGFDQKPYQAHFEFWKDKDVPDSWKKFKSIALYWLEKGVDGFRYDMAEMVPVEFWSYMNSAIKTKNPDAFLLAEVYNPAEYRNYIRLGKMDYLYDKVELYDTLKAIIHKHSRTTYISDIQNRMADIEHHMLHFLENHDEQRIASPDFAGNPQKALPAMVVSATISSAPTMIYFGQEVGETGSEHAGFGNPSRTSIFDYIGVPHHQRWMNNGKFDGGQLSKDEKSLRDYYQKLLNFTLQSEALTGSFEEIHSFNENSTEGYGAWLYAFARWSESEKLIVVTNFDDTQTYEFDLKIPLELLKKWHLNPGTYSLTDQLNLQNVTTLVYKKNLGTAHVKIRPLESFIFQLK
ncbi:MAG: alpha-amylase [Flavobacteriales bacterium CG_4_9_14_3_um_filter_40_17]|nr:MAG: alpha-amylase [Flavobacteriales bacterium CG_4_9_14_3_um_filter_40_17]